MSAARFAIPSRWLQRLVAPVGAVAVGCGMASGCAEQAAPAPLAVEEEAPVEMELNWQERPLGGIASRGAQAMMVKSRPAPLVYLVETPQVVRVLNQTNKSILAEVPVGGRTIVRVDALTGVVAGSQTLVAEK